MEPLTATSAVSGTGEEKSESDREPSPEDSAHSDTAVSIPKIKVPQNTDLGFRTRFVRLLTRGILQSFQHRAY